MSRRLIPLTNFSVSMFIHPCLSLVCDRVNFLSSSLYGVLFWFLRTWATWATSMVSLPKAGELELDDLWGPFQPKAFYDSMTNTDVLVIADQSLHWVKDFSISHPTPPVRRLGVHKRLRGDRARTADSNWPVGYSISYDIMHSSKSW